MSGRKGETPAEAQKSDAPMPEAQPAAVDVRPKVRVRNGGDVDLMIGRSGDQPGGELVLKQGVTEISAADWDGIKPHVRAYLEPRETLTGTRAPVLEVY